jgi:hypothetical protein
MDAVSFVTSEKGGFPGDFGMAQSARFALE